MVSAAWLASSHHDVSAVALRRAASGARSAAAAWRALLEQALRAVDAVRPKPTRSLRGGTALALVLGHRVSYDIDSFLEDAAALHSLSPSRNPASRSRLERDEGELGFMLASRLTEAAPRLLAFGERHVPVERPLRYWPKS